MGMVKYSVLALLIMLPFFLQSSIQNTQHKYMERQRTWIEQSIDEASYDAGFALKTYSTYAYDSHNAYHIQIAYQEVIRNFFDSLTMRNFRYTRQDFPLIAFVEYDGIVLYNPQENTLGEKTFYTQQETTHCEYYTLSDKKWVYNYSTGLVTQESAEINHKNSIIMQTIEQELNAYQQNSQEKQRMRFNLPEFEGESSTYVFDDVGIIIFYDPKSYAYLDGIETYRIIPSGIMKMDLAIDL